MFDDSFFSADRLVEFGLGMAMAQQMVNTMNKTMQSMQVPGSMATMPQLGNIHVAIDGKAMGPLTEAEFARLASERRINKDTLVWIPGMLGTLWSKCPKSSRLWHSPHRHSPPCNQ